MTKLGISSEFINQPLIYALRENLIDHPFELIEIPEWDILNRLQAGEVEIGIISPLQYAQSQGDLLLIEDLIIESHSAPRNALLFFQGELDRINKIHFINKPADNFNLFLGKIILAELFKVHADWVELDETTSIEIALSNHPVIFLGGQKAFSTFTQFENYIDLAEEWILKSHLPLIYRVVVANQNFDDRGELSALRLARELGIRNVRKIAKDFADKLNLSWTPYFELITESYQYFPQENSWDSLRDMLQYIFFYGKSEYLQETKFL